MNDRVPSARLWLAAWRIAWRLRRRPLEEVALELAEEPVVELAEADTESPGRLAARVDRIVNRWSVPLAGPCLVRSLLVYSMARGVGSGLELVLGFDLRDGARGLRGHAWLRSGEGPLRAEDAAAAAAYPHTVVLS